MPASEKERRAAARMVQIVSVATMAQQQKSMMREIMATGDAQRFAQMVRQHTAELHAFFNNMGLKFVKDGAGAKKLNEIVASQMQKGIDQSHSRVDLELTGFDFELMGAYGCDLDCGNCSKLKEAIKQWGSE
jgi:hypothetical protein